MLLHYVGFAIRHLTKSRLYSAITIGGFAIGLAAAILLTLFIRHEVTYDTWLPNADRTYRTHLTLDVPGREPIRSVRSPGPLGPMLAAYAPEVEKAARIVDDRATLRQGTTAVRVDISFVDPNLFEVLEVPVLRGDAAATLADMSGLIVTETAAATYLGPGDPIGKTLTLCCFADKPFDFRVGAVLRDLPETTHLSFGLLARLDPLREEAMRRQLERWESLSGYTYLRLRPGADPAALEKGIPALLAEKIPPLTFGDRTLTLGDLYHAELVEVRDIHLRGKDDAGTLGDMRVGGDAATVEAMAAVGILLLLIGISNFLNLATARAARRAKEIAIRRVNGAGRGDIIVQYLGEAVLIAAVAMVVALALVELALPWFQQIADRRLPSPHDAALLGALAAGAVALGVISGLYPAIGLARLDPSAVMRANQGSIASGSSRVRQVLVFTQFATAVVLAIVTAVVIAQARHAADQDLGFHKLDTLVVRFGDSRLDPVRQTLVERIRRVPGVAATTLASYMPGDEAEENLLVDVPGDSQADPLLITSLAVDYDFFTALGVQPIAGRTLSREHPGDDLSPNAAAPDREYSVIANMAAVRRLGFPSATDAVGQVLRGHLNPTRSTSLRIVGVVPDMHFRSARFAVEPTLFGRDTDSFGRLVIRFRPGTGPVVSAAVRDLWAVLAPEVPHIATLLEDQIDAQYRDEQRLANTLAGSAFLALVVACLGLYGLASFLTESRQREIAIRKVLGASTRDIVSLLAWQLARPILLACVIAVPVAYALADRWLSAFAFRIDLGVGLFATVVGAALLVAAATVVLQTVRAARARPVAMLHAE